MKCEDLAVMADGTSKMILLFQDVAREFSPDLDGLVDELIGLDLLLKSLEEAAEIVSHRKERTAKDVATAFIDKAQDSVTRRGKTVYLAKEYWPGPSIRDLLPPDATEADPNYDATVASCRAHAKDRLLQALKNSANLAGLVTENYNANSLRSALTGPSAERDALDVPVLPPELVGLVELNPRDVIRMRKGGKGCA